MLMVPMQPPQLTTTTMPAFDLLHFLRHQNKLEVSRTDGEAFPHFLSVF